MGIFCVRERCGSKTYDSVVSHVPRKTRQHSPTENVLPSFLPSFLPPCFVLPLCELCVVEKPGADEGLGIDDHVSTFRPTSHNVEIKRNITAYRSSLNLRSYLKKDVKGRPVSPLLVEQNEADDDRIWISAAKTARKKEREVAREFRQKLRQIKAASPSSARWVCDCA